MSAEENKALVRRFVEQAWNKRNIAIIDELYAPDCALKDATGTPFMGGSARAVYKEVLPKWFGALPDVSVSIEDIIAVGDRVVTRFIYGGTHQGDFPWGPHPPYKPTGKRVALGLINISRIAGGKIVEEWFACDFTEVWRQFGALPA